MSLSQSRKGMEGSDNMGMSPRRRRGDLQVVKHQFFESGNHFAQYSLSALKACGKGE